MTILKAGTFPVRRYRKAIPEAIKTQLTIDRIRYDIEAGNPVEWEASAYQHDHRPPLLERDYDTDFHEPGDGDFIPPQNDPRYLFAVLKSEHLYLTIGRKPGAARTVTTRGSDVGEASRSRDIQASEAVFQARMAAKAGNHAAVNEILATARPKRQKKGSIPSRPFPKRQQKASIPSRPFPKPWLKLP